MKILIAHNHYGDFATGGEAMVFHAETNLLKSYGYEVLTYERSNSELNNKSLRNRVNAVLNLHWSERTIAEVGKIMDEFKPDVLHVHNYKFLITPSIFYAAKQRGIKTVLTLHNYRLMVPCGNFMTKDGKVCEKCLKESPVNILKYRCAQGSFLKSFLQYRLFTKTKFKLNHLNPDVVITSGFNPTMLLAWLWTLTKKKKHIPFSDANIHSESKLSYFHKLIRKLVYKTSNVFLGASDKTLELFKTYNIEDNKLFKSCLAIDNENFKPKKTSEKNTIYCFVASLMNEKIRCFLLNWQNTSMI